MAYSQPLLTLACSNPREIKEFEQSLVTFILDQYFSKNAPRSCVVHIDKSLALNFDLLHELVKLYGLVSRNAAEQYAVLVMLVEDHIPAIPKCSCAKMAVNSKGNEDVGKSNKYSNSRLRIQRPTVSLDSRDQQLSREYTEDEVRCVCVIQNVDEPAPVNSRFEALSEKVERKRPNHDSISPTEDCCVCLEPLLQITRAERGETLCVLNCRHVLHSSCAHEVRTYHTGSASGHALPNGSFAPDLGHMRCPICRSESLSTIEAPLTLVRKTTGAPVVITPATKKQTRKKAPRLKNLVDTSEDEIYAELLAMGFDDLLVREEIERTNGNKAMAINHLLSLSS